MKSLALLLCAAAAHAGTTSNGVAGSPDDDHHTTNNLPANSVGPGFDDPGMQMPSDWIGSSSYDGATTHRYSNGVDPTSTYEDNDAEIAQSATSNDDDDDVGTGAAASSYEMQQCLSKCPAPRRLVTSDDDHPDSTPGTIIFTFIIIDERIFTFISFTLTRMIV
jgi:hypothetical protein